jgi:hypothetical protein
MSFTGSRTANKIASVCSAFKEGATQFGFGSFARYNTKDNLKKSKTYDVIGKALCDNRSDLVNLIVLQGALVNPNGLLIKAICKYGCPEALCEILMRDNRLSQKKMDYGLAEDSMTGFTDPKIVFSQKDLVKVMKGCISYGHDKFVEVLNTIFDDSYIPEFVPVKFAENSEMFTEAYNAHPHIYFDINIYKIVAKIMNGLLQSGCKTFIIGRFVEYVNTVFVNIPHIEEYHRLTKFCLKEKLWPNTGSIVIDILRKCDQEDMYIQTGYVNDCDEVFERRMLEIEDNRTKCNAFIKDIILNDLIAFNDETIGQFMDMMQFDVELMRRVLQKSCRGVSSELFDKLCTEAYEQ